MHKKAYWLFISLLVLVSCVGLCVLAGAWVAGLPWLYEFKQNTYNSITRLLGKLTNLSIKYNECHKQRAWHKFIFHVNLLVFSEYLLYVPEMTFHILFRRQRFSRFLMFMLIPFEIILSQIIFLWWILSLIKSDLLVITVVKSQILFVITVI